MDIRFRPTRWLDMWGAGSCSWTLGETASLYPATIFSAWNTGDRNDEWCDYGYGKIRFIVSMNWPMGSTLRSIKDSGDPGHV